MINFKYIFQYSKIIKLILIQLFILNCFCVYNVNSIISSDKSTTKQLSPSISLRDNSISIYVSISKGNDTIGNGTIQSPFQSIRKAVSTMDTDNIYSVFLDQGIYNDPLLKLPYNSDIILTNYPDVNEIDLIEIDSVNIISKSSNMTIANISPNYIIFTEETGHSAQLAMVNCNTFKISVYGDNIQFQIHNSNISHLAGNISSLYMDGVNTIGYNDQVLVTDSLEIVNSNLYTIFIHASGNQMVRVNNSLIANSSLEIVGCPNVQVCNSVFSFVDISTISGLLQDTPFAIYDSIGVIDNINFDSIHNKPNVIVAVQSSLNISNTRFKDLELSSTIIQTIKSQVNINNITMDSGSSPFVFHTENSQLNINDFDLNIQAILLSTQNNPQIYLNNGIVRSPRSAGLLDNIGGGINLTITNTLFQNLKGFTCEVCSVSLQNVHIKSNSIFSGVVIRGSNFTSVGLYLDSLSTSDTDYLISLSNSKVVFDRMHIEDCTNPITASRSNIIMTNSYISKVYSRNYMNFLSSYVVMDNIIITNYLSQFRVPIFSILLSEFYMSNSLLGSCNSNDGLFNLVYSNMTLFNTTLENSIFLEYGFNIETNSRLVINNSYISSSSLSNNDYGFFYVSMGTLIVHKLTATSLTTSLIMEAKTSTVEVTESTIQLSANRFISSQSSTVNMRDVYISGPGSINVITLSGSSGIIEGLDLMSIYNFNSLVMVWKSSFIFNGIRVKDCNTLTTDSTIFSIEGANLTQTNSNIDGNKCEYIYTVISSNVLLSTVQMNTNFGSLIRTSFLSNFTMDGCFIYMTKLQLQNSQIFVSDSGLFNMSNCSFQANYAETSPIYFEDKLFVGCVISNNQFYSNRGLKGGVFQFGDSGIHCNFTGNLFKWNYAELAGGSIYTVSPFLLIDSSNVFEDDKAKFYGDSVASDKSYINISISETITNDEPITFSIAVYDRFDNQVTTEAGDLVVYINSIWKPSSSSPTFDFNNQSFSISLIGGFARVNVDSLIGAPVGSIYQIIVRQDTLFAETTIIIAPCHPFQYISPNSSICQFCESINNVYSPSQQQCVACNTEKLSQCYRANVATIKNYWLYNSDINMIYRCSQNLCLGDNQCLEGQTGVLCSQCPSKIYNKSSIYCCKNNNIVIFIMYLVFLIFLILVLSLAPAIFNHPVFGSLTIFLQSVAILLYSQMNLYIVPLFRMSLDYVPFRCTGLPFNYYGKIAFSFTSTIIIIGVGGLTSKFATTIPILKQIQQNQSIDGTRNSSYFWSSVMLFFGPLVFDLFSLALPCRQIGSKHYLFMDFDVECDSSQIHFAVQILASIALGLMLLLMPVLYLYRHYSTMDWREFSIHYKPKARWWGAFHMLKMTSYCVSTLSLLYQSQIMVAVQLTLQTIFMSIQYIVRPYKLRSRNQTENISNFFLLIILIISGNSFISAFTRGIVISAITLLFALAITIISSVQTYHKKVK